MRAACWNGARDIQVQDVPDPRILNPRDAIVRVTLTAICGSDLHLYNNFFPGMRRGDITGHPAPFYLDNNMHDLQLERFFAPRMENGLLLKGDGPIKAFTLRGLKDSPPYLHDGRLLTIDDTVEFFNLVLALNLTASEKSDLVAFLRTL